jgi:hypothetical protein
VRRFLKEEDVCGLEGNESIRIEVILKSMHLSLERYEAKETGVGGRLCFNNLLVNNSARRGYQGCLPFLHYDEKICNKKCVPLVNHPLLLQKICL